MKAAGTVDQWWLNSSVTDGHSSPSMWTAAVAQQGTWSAPLINRRQRFLCFDKLLNTFREDLNWHLNLNCSSFWLRFVCRHHTGYWSCTIYQSVSGLIFSSCSSKWLKWKHWFFPLHSHQCTVMLYLLWTNPRDYYYTVWSDRCVGCAQLASVLRNHTQISYKWIAVISKIQEIGWRVTVMHQGLSSWWGQVSENRLAALRSCLSE